MTKIQRTENSSQMEPNGNKQITNRRMLTFVGYGDDARIGYV